MKIDGLRGLYAPFLNAVEAGKKADIVGENGAGERDSYISSGGNHNFLCSTGNYDEFGQMDDDFSINLKDENDLSLQAIQYSMEYANQTVKTVAKSGTSDNEMNRNQKK